MPENKKYKYEDYLNRTNDPYALKKYSIIMDWLPKTDNLKILNAGCGSGEMNILLSQNSSWSIDAIDPDEEAVKLSEQIKNKYNITNLKIIHSDIENFRKENFYDIITTNDVLEHIEDDKAAIRKLSNLLKPGGIICISVPALQVLFGYHDEMLGHYRRYSRKNLVKKLSEYFEVEKIRHFGVSLIPFTILYSKILKRAYPNDNLGKNKMKTKILNFILRLDAKLPLPLGISILTYAKRK